MANLTLAVGVKTDPVENRYSYEWLFRIMAEEGVYDAQLGSFFEMYSLPNEFFRYLRQQAARFGVRVSSVFTTHRDLGGFFRREPGFHDVALRSWRRMIEIGVLLGADFVGGSAGAVLRDQLPEKEAGVERFLDALQGLLRYARQAGLPALTVEPMSCLAEPPTTPHEIVAWAETVRARSGDCPQDYSAFGYCVDVAHGYLDSAGRPGWDNVELFRATLPYLRSVHLKNTDARFDATFGFSEPELARGIVDVGMFRELLIESAGTLPVERVVGYLELSGPKTGRDYSDPLLEAALRSSFRYLNATFPYSMP